MAAETIVPAGHCWLDWFEMIILVTGGAGFIGSHIVEHFQGRAEVRVLDNFRSGFTHNLAGLEHDLIAGSMLDRELVRQAMTDVDLVFHLAALVSVPESMANPAECHELNTTGTLVVLEEAARARVKKLVFSSSAAIYGDHPALPKTETMTPQPKSPYASSKLAGEILCGQFAREGKLSTACLRYFNVFGPRQNPRSQYAAAVPVFIERALRHEPLTLHGDGEQTRDFIFVKDIAAANDFFAAQPAATGVFNLAGGKSTRIKQLAADIVRLTGSRSETVHAPERAGDVKHSLASVEKLRAAGFAPAASFDEGMKTTIESFALIRLAA